MFRVLGVYNFGAGCTLQVQALSKYHSYGNEQNRIFPLKKIIATIIHDQLLLKYIGYDLAKVYKIFPSSTESKQPTNSQHLTLGSRHSATKAQLMMLSSHLSAEDANAKQPTLSH